MNRRTRLLRGSLFLLLALLLLTGARTRPVRMGERPVRVAPADPFSFSNPREIAVTHVSLDLEVDFDARVIDGVATLSLNNRTGGTQLILDTADLTVRRIVLDDGSEAFFEVLDPDEILGAPLRVIVRPDTKRVAIEYRTSPTATGLHWMSPEQAQTTAPYLYSQNETIGARSWIPVQDSPSVRMTWDATIRVPEGFLALMSAENPTETTSDGVYTFAMDVPIPAYLQSLAVSELVFRAIDSRSGVYATPGRVDAAHAELQVVPAMMTAAEAICGPYIWDRYDVLIMPPSYHIGGMEHPRLTFATPSFISGDGSLVSLIAHELAHSWAGDQVTTATWNDIWINEGLTVYLEFRIMEAVYGDDFEEMIAESSLRSAAEFIEESPSDPDTRLHVDLRGRHPDEGFTTIPYDKGGAFWRTLEAGVGRAKLDTFLKSYFSRHSLDWMDADAIVELILEQLLSNDTALEQQLRVQEWVYDTGLPENVAIPDSERFRRVDEQRDRFAAGTPVASLDTTGWTALEYIYFLDYAPVEAMLTRMAEFPSAWGLDSTPNLRLLAIWSYWVAGIGHLPSLPAMERFLGSVGGGLAPVLVYYYLVEGGYDIVAEVLYPKYRPRYHPYTQAAIDYLLDFEAKRLPPPRFPVKY